MNTFNFIRSRVIAYYAAGAVATVFGFLWLLFVVPLFTGPSGNGDHNGIGLLIGVALTLLIFVKVFGRVLRFLSSRYEADERAYREQVWQQEREWRRDHPG